MLLLRITALWLLVLAALAYLGWLVSWSSSTAGGLLSFGLAAFVASMLPPPSREALR